jgi:alkylhydroperoxidase family enzyme
MNYRAPAAREQGLEEETICTIPDASSSPRLTAAEKAAVRFAELLALDHQKIGDEVLGELARHFTERQIVEIGWAAGAFIGFGRLIHVFGGKWEPLPGEAPPLPVR